MASGNSSGLGSSLFRGALHGSSTNTGSGNNSSLTSGGSSNSSTQHHHSHHHHHHHHHHTSSHHLQQGIVPGSSHLQHSQSTAPSQPQPSVGPVWFTPKDNGHGRGSTTSPNHMSTLMAKLWFDHNVESSLAALKKEVHEKRLRDLRKELDYIADTDWKYSPVEKYIGKQ